MSSAEDHDLHDFLNVEAVFALHGQRADIKNTLISLLRSNAPIDPVVREELAQALESEDEGRIRLKIEGTGSGKKNNAGALIQKRQEWLIIGGLVQELILSGVSRTKAVLQVENVQLSSGRWIGMGQSQAQEALNYFRKFQAFKAKHSDMAEGFLRIGAPVEQLMESLFIRSDIDDAGETSRPFATPSWDTGSSTIEQSSSE